MKKTNNKGFSLIELIIVIAIMAILVAIIAPNLTKYLGKSKKNTDTKNKDEIESTIKTCITDYEMDNGTLISDTSKDIKIKWVASGTSAEAQNNGGTLSAPSSFLTIVNEAIEGSKTKSKENSAQYADVTITVSSNGQYNVAVTFS